MKVRRERKKEREKERERERKRERRGDGKPAALPCYESLTSEEGICSVAAQNKITSRLRVFFF